MRLDRDIVKLAEKLLLHGFVLRWIEGKGLLVSKEYLGKVITKLVDRGYPHMAGIIAKKIDSDFQAEAEKRIAEEKEAAGEKTDEVQK